jgi:transposase
MPADLREQDYDCGGVLYMALELSDAKWRLAFGDGVHRRQVTIAAWAIGELLEQIGKAKAKWGLGAQARVVSCYEAGRDGFWLHRQLGLLGIGNRVVDASSIEVSRRARRVKTDRIDADGLLGKLIRYEAGERGVWREVRVPSVQWEDLRQLQRERGELLAERTRHHNRLTSKLVAQGVRLPIDGRFAERLEEVRLFDGRPLPAHLKAGLLREWERLKGVSAQLKGLEAAIGEQIKASAPLPATPAGPLGAVHVLMGLCGIGWVGATILVMEIFGWREMANRRQLGSLAGLVPVPYQSGSQGRDQGISKAGNRRVRALLIQLAWLWLRYQPHSKLSLWFGERFGGGSKRLRRIGIVAVARRLLIDLWRFIETGTLPPGAQLKAG